MDNPVHDEQALKKLVEQDPLNSFGHRKLAELYFDRGERATALKHCLSVIDLEPEDLNARQMAAVLLFQLSKYRQAHDHLEELHRRNSDLSSRVVESWLEQPNTDDETSMIEAAQAGCRLVENLVGEAELLRNISFDNRTRGQGLRLGQIYLLIGQTSSAVAALKKIPVESDLIGVKTVVTTAEALAQSGLSTMAFEKLEEVRLEKFSFAPDDTAEVAYRMASLYDLLGVPDQAFKHFKKVIKMRINYRDALSRAVQLRENIGDNAEPAPKKQIDELSVIPSTFRNVKLLGRGGMGSVYSAFDTVRGETVAIKVISAFRHGDARSVDLFLREAQAMQVLTHPNIITVYRVHRGAYPFMVLEYVDGNTVRQILLEHGTLPVPQVKYIATQVAMAMHHAHTKGLVHRDLKPDNIMLDSKGRVKVMDFGLAEAKTSLNVDEAAVAGTIYYMSPEQLQGEKTDARSDIYSFGVMLYELLSGLKPFPEGDIAYRHIYEEPNLPASLKQVLPPYLEEIMLRCLEKQPHRRYQSWHSLLEDLRSEKTRGYSYHGYRSEEELAPRQAVESAGPASVKPVRQNVEVAHFLPDRFTDVRSLGRRGGCEDFKAFDTGTKRAVRVVRIDIEEMEQEVLDLFRERLEKTTGELHPNIMPVLDYIFESAVVLIVLEDTGWYRLETKRVMNDGVREDTVWNMASGIGRGLAWLHQRELVHGALSRYHVWTDGGGRFKIDLFTRPGQGENPEKDLAYLGKMILAGAGGMSGTTAVLRAARRAVGVEHPVITTAEEFLQALAPSEEKTAQIVARERTVRRGKRIRLIVLVVLLLAATGVLIAAYLRQARESVTAGSMLAEGIDIGESKHFFHGLVFLEKGAVSEARLSFERALQDDPENDEARFYLARILVGRRKCEEALPQLEQLLAAGHRPSETESLLRMALYQAGADAMQRGDYVAAAGHMDRALARGFKDGTTAALAEEAYTALGKELVENNAVMRAMPYYYKAMEMAEDKKMFHIRLGKCFQLLGDEIKADEHFRKFLKLGGTRQELRRQVYGD